MTQAEPLPAGHRDTLVPEPGHPSEISGEETDDLVTLKSVDSASAPAACHASHCSASTSGDLSSDGSSDQGSPRSRADVRDDEIPKTSLLEAEDIKAEANLSTFETEVPMSPPGGEEDPSQRALLHLEAAENTWQTGRSQGAEKLGVAGKEGGMPSPDDLREGRGAERSEVHALPSLASPFPGSLEQSTSSPRLVSSPIRAPHGGRPLSPPVLPLRGASLVASGPTSLPSSSPPSSAPESAEESSCSSSPTSNHEGSSASLPANIPASVQLVAPSSRRVSPYPLPPAPAPKDATASRPIDLSQSDSAASQLLTVPKADGQRFQHTLSAAPPSATGPTTHDGAPEEASQRPRPSAGRTTFSKLLAEYEAALRLVRAREKAQQYVGEIARKRQAGASEDEIAAWLKKLPREDFNLLLRYVRKLAGPKVLRSTEGTAGAARFSEASALLGPDRPAALGSHDRYPRDGAHAQPPGRPTERPHSPPGLHFLLSARTRNDRWSADVAGLERHLRSAVQCADASAGASSAALNLLPDLTPVRQAVHRTPAEEEEHRPFEEELYEARKMAFHRQEAARYGGYVSCLACGCTVCGCSKFCEGQPSWVSTLLLTSPPGSLAWARQLEGEFDKKNAERAAASGKVKGAPGGRPQKKTEKATCHVYNTRCSSGASGGNLATANGMGSGKGSLHSEAPSLAGGNGKTANGGPWASWKGWARRSQTPKQRRTKDSSECGIREANTLSQGEDGSEDEGIPSSAKESSVYSLPSHEHSTTLRHNRGVASATAPPGRTLNFLEPDTLPCFSASGRRRHTGLHQDRRPEEGMTKLAAAYPTGFKNVPACSRTARRQPISSESSSDLSCLRPGAQASSFKEPNRLRGKTGGEPRNGIGEVRQGKRARQSAEFQNDGVQSKRARTSSLRGNGKNASLSVREARDPKGTELVRQRAAKALGHKEGTQCLSGVSDPSGTALKDSLPNSWKEGQLGASSRPAPGKGTLFQRRQFRVHHMIPEPQVKEGLVFNPTPAQFNKYPKARGVWFDPHRNLVRTCWKENGKAKTVGFPVAKFGLDEARFLAVQLHQFKCPDDPVPSDLQGKLPTVPPPGVRVVLKEQERGTRKRSILACFQHCCIAAYACNRRQAWVEMRPYDALVARLPQATGTAKQYGYTVLRNWP